MMEKLTSFLQASGVADPAGRAEKCLRYMKGILEWNNKVNMTSITNEADFEVKHFIDSLSCMSSPEIMNSEKIADIGTGAGFPGIPLAIVFPEKSFVLIDSTLKRLKIVEELAAAAGLSNIAVVHGRAEELARKPEFREDFDVCVSRAVARLPVLCEYCLPFVRVGGSFISYKGPDGRNELNEAEHAVAALGGSVDRIEMPDLDYDLDHILIYINKVKKTDRKYPRGGGKSARDPLR